MWAYSHALARKTQSEWRGVSATPGFVRRVGFGRTHVFECCLIPRTATAEMPNQAPPLIEPDRDRIVHALVQTERCAIVKRWLDR